MRLLLAMLAMLAMLVLALSAQAGKPQPLNLDNVWPEGCDGQRQNSYPMQWSSG